MSPSGLAGGGVTGAPDNTFQIWSLLRAMAARDFSNEQSDDPLVRCPAPERATLRIWQHRCNFHIRSAQTACDVAITSKRSALDSSVVPVALGAAPALPEHGLHCSDRLGSV